MLKITPMRLIDCLLVFVAVTGSVFIAAQAQQPGVTVGRRRSQRRRAPAPAERREIHEESAVGKLLQQIRRCLQRQPRLAGPAGTGEGDQAVSGSLQHAAQGGQFLLSPDQRSQLRR